MMKARRARACAYTAELLDRVHIALRHNLHGAENQHDAGDHQKKRNQQSRIIRKIDIHPNRPPQP
jgi:hypothetical protein